MEKLKEFLPADLRKRMVVAGGYAVDPRLASDIDIWVVRREPKDPADRWRVSRQWDADGDIDAIREHLNEQGIPYLGGCRHELVKQYANGRMLVATVQNGYEGKDVQILVALAESAQELVDGFDISTHMLGKYLHPAGSAMQVAFGRQWTSPSEPAKVTRWDTPEQTLERLDKIVVRYDVMFNAFERERLVRLVEQKEAERRQVAELDEILAELLRAA